MTNTAPVPVISLVKDQPRTLSTDVAAFFGKPHKNVLRDIRNIMSNCPDDFCRLNFELINKSTDLGHTTRQDPVYSI